MARDSGGPTHSRRLRIKRFIAKTARLGAGGLRWSKREYKRRRRKIKSQQEAPGATESSPPEVSIPLK